MDIAVSSKMGRRRGVTKEHIRMDLRLGNNKVAGPFLQKPSGLMVFWSGALSLLAFRSIRDMLARRSAPQTEIPLSSNIQKFL
jgi:hypothetical protein